MIEIRNYQTGEHMRAATLEEWRCSLEAAEHDGGPGVYQDPQTGVSVYVDGNPELTLGDLLGLVSGGLVRTDRGNGSAGPVYLGEAPSTPETRSLKVYLVTEEDDPDAWRLAREALATLIGDDDSGEPELVAVTDPNPQPGEYVAIYAG